jgi:hypothetical protein
MNGAWILDGLLLIVLGVLAVPGLIIAKRPDAKRYIDKLAPYQGWIGTGMAIYGIVRLLSWFGMFGWLGWGFGGIIKWAVFTVFVYVSIALGFMLGVGVIKSFVKDANARAKMDEVLARLAPKQGMLGLVALADGILMLIFGIVPNII